MPRLTSVTLVSALLRRASAEGGNAVVVARGDATAGSIVLICLEKGVRSALRERILGGDGRYGWAATGPDSAASESDVDDWLARRRSRDPDLWIVELDIPNAERFAAETSGDD